MSQDSDTFPAQAGMGSVFRGTPPPLHEKNFFVYLNQLFCLPDLDSRESSEIGEAQYLDEELDKAFPGSPNTESYERHPLFPNTIPAKLPTQSDSGKACSFSSRWQIPEYYRTHWERVPETVRQIPINMKGFEAACMTIGVEHEGKMYSESKCFRFLSSNSLDILAGPHDGVTYTFVAMCLSGMPDHALKVLYFFDMVRIILQSQDRSPFVFPTDKIGLLVRTHLWQALLCILRMCCTDLQEEQEVSDGIVLQNRSMEPGCRR